jgi:hypothetical protein
MSRRWRMIYIAPLAILGMAAFIAIGGEIVLHLWNWLLPPLFGWRQITFWQALGILVLCRVLFGGLGRHGYRGSNFRRRIKGRCENMTLRSGNDSGNGCANVGGVAHPQARAKRNETGVAAKARR